jgi:hypothetical protein
VAALPAVALLTWAGGAPAVGAVAAVEPPVRSAMSMAIKAAQLLTFARPSAARGETP